MIPEKDLLQHILAHIPVHTDHSKSGQKKALIRINT